MKEYNVKTDKEFFDKIINIKWDIQRMASLFQNEGSITNEEEVKEWSMFINKVIEKIEKIKSEGYSRLELRG